MEKKITNWVEEGLIDKQTALKMLEDIKQDKQKSAKIKINITIYTIAVILIGLGVITFISANDWILELLNSNNLLKIILMSILTFASFVIGYNLCYEKKNFPRLGNALIVLSTLLIGGTYALIGQIYNLNANSSYLMFLWLLSILPVAYYFKNNSINIISIILAIFTVTFFYAELSLDKELVWTVFLPILCGIMLYSAGNIPYVLNKYPDFSLSYKITGALPIFITLLVLTCSVENSYHITSAYYIVPIISLIFINLINYFYKKDDNNLLKIETAALITMLLVLLLMLVLPSVCPISVMLLSNISIILMIAFGFNYGYKFENIQIVTVANWILTIYLTVNYCRWGWSFMNKSLFFTLGGSCLLILGLFLESKRKIILRKDKK